MLFTDTYRTITSLSTATYREKASKFISLAIPVETEEEIKAQLQALKKEYYDANHHCFAWQLGCNKDAQRMNDDGEPSGTAGRPIFGQIQSYDLTNILVVVIRYFGGTKLGVSGLIQAYKTTAKLALDSATIIEKTVNTYYRITYPFEMMNEIMKFCKDRNLQIIATHFDLECTLDFHVRMREADIIYGDLLKKNGIAIQYLQTK